MYQYATSVPDRIALEPEWLEGLKRAKLKRIEYSCGGACTAENMGEKVQIMAELQAAGGVIVGSIHIPFGKTWEFADHRVGREHVVGSRLHVHHPRHHHDAWYRRYGSDHRYGR